MPLRSLAILLILAAGCAESPDAPLALDTDWDFVPNRGYINRRTLDQKSPDDFFAHGGALRDDRRPAEAACVFRLLADTAPDPDMRSRALFRQGECLVPLRAYAQAFLVFEAYQSRYPDGEYATPAKRGMMECALGLARVGQTETLLGIPILTSAAAGLELLHKTLKSFPREDFSDDFYYRLAVFHHQRGELDEAELELKFILSDPTYKRSNSAPRALLLLGRIGLERYDGPYYDHRPLADAKRAYEQFTLDYKNLAPAQALELGLDRDLEVLLSDAQKGIDLVNEWLADRELMLAEYYEDRGHPGAAKVYLKYVLKNYPNTKGAARAQEWMNRLNGGANAE